MAWLEKTALIVRSSMVWGAVRIHRWLENKYGKGVVSQRTVSTWISHSESTTSAQERPPWRRWEPSLWQQDAGYLLRLDLIARTLRGDGLYDDEALWATRLELALQALHPFAQWAFVEEFAARHHHSIEPETGDLDLVIATQPWLDDGRMFAVAFRRGLAPVPFMPRLLSWPDGLQTAVALRVVDALEIPVELAAPVMVPLRDIWPEAHEVRPDLPPESTEVQMLVPHRSRISGIWPDDTEPPEDQSGPARWGDDWRNLLMELWERVNAPGQAERKAHEDGE